MLEITPIASFLASSDVRGKGQPGASCLVSVLFLLQAPFLASSRVTCSNQDGPSPALPIIVDGSPKLPEVIRPPTPLHPEVPGAEALG